MSSTCSAGRSRHAGRARGVDEHGHPVLSRRVSRNKLLEAVVCLPCCRIVMEACDGALSFVKKTRETPDSELRIARKRLKEVQRHD
ncbi:hypothetical protein C7H84_35475 [Burkholderia sp. Nafp2/4-1b]|nr:hypothetical protein C7H84_35475 [Burkholderia sp. Nafp2/4-1b]